MNPEVVIAISGIAGFLIGTLVTWALIGSRYYAERTGYQVAIEGMKKEREADREKFRWLETAEEKLRDSFNALANRVIIVSPATLLALLKVASMGWMQLQLSQNARKIADQGKELYNRFGVFSNHFSDIGRKLAESVVSFNRAVGSMETRVLPSARKLKELGAGSEDIGDIPGIDVQARKPVEFTEE